MLQVRADPSNAKGLIADLSPVAAGNVEIMWHVLSVDGHAISGTLHFVVVGAAPLLVDTSEKKVTPKEQAEPSRPTLTWLAMVLRGLGMSSLMAFAGLLMFASASTGGATQHSSLAGKLVATAFVALLGHFMCWALVSTSGLPGAQAMDVLRTSTGKVEAGRTLLAVLALAAWFARKPRLSLVLAGAGVLSGAFAGHAAAIQPVFSISSKLLHLAAASVWFGGLIWILLLDTNNSAVFRVQVERVSNAAGWCAVLVLVSGIVQAGIVLSWDTGSLTSTYAIVAGLKLLGVVVLMGLGAINRFRLLPALGIVGFSQKLQSTVGREVGVMILVALLGGVLAYVSPPVSRHTVAQPYQSTAPSPVRT
jgi:putative copper export protein